MTVPIRKGESWGVPGPLPRHGVVVADDADLTEIVVAAQRAGEPVPPFGLVGGDLCRTLGGRGDRDRLRYGEAMTFTVDLARARLDDEEHVFAAHLVAHHRMWLGRWVAVMNAAWLGDWNLGPRAHPGDGLLDTSDAHLRPAELFLARRRFRQGTHVPHPRIVTRRASTAEVTFARPMPVRLDGRLVGRFRHVAVTVVPDALTVVV